MPVHDWTRVMAGAFHDFHHEWISCIKRALNLGLLPSEYYAMAEQIEGGPSPEMLALTAKTEIEVYAEKRSRVVIRHRSGDEVVAIIEIVSPGNKSNRYALQQFVSKIHELLRAGVHMLVADLFPPSPRDPQGIHGAIWERFEDQSSSFELPLEEPLTMVAYTGGLERQAFIEPVGIGKPLPDMPLFLCPPGHVMVPLEKTYQSAFEGVPERWRRELQ